MALAYGSSDCKSAAQETTLAERAFKIYQSTSSQNLFDFLDFAQRVVRYDPLKHGRPKLVTQEYMGAACSHGDAWKTTDYWAMLQTRPEPLIMVGSMFKHAYIYDDLVRLRWKRKLPWASEVASLGFYECVYVRWPDRGPWAIDDVVFTRRPAPSTSDPPRGRGSRSRPSRTVYLASAHEADALCRKFIQTAMPEKKYQTSSCLSLPSLSGDRTILPGWSTAASASIVDMYTCSQATDGGYCGSYKNGSTFWQWIRTLSRHETSFPFWCEPLRPKT